MDVATGELRAARGGVLRASALGSCIAVVLYDPSTGIGGLAHVMLPGAAPPGRRSGRTRYAEQGIEELVAAVAALGARREPLVACIAGGANVLERASDTVWEANIASVTRTLERLGLALEAGDVGGTERRSVTIDLNTGRVMCAVGDGAPALLGELGGPRCPGDEMG